jgi:PBP1b-binding outer membrane lipoprotein LpoB
MRNTILAIFMAVALAGCASVPMATPEADAAAKAFRVTPNKANVYIYRNENFGAAIKMPLLIDNVAVGDTAAKTYVFRQIDPGSHVITSKTENDATLSLDVKAGTNYFVWQEVKMGAFSARSDLHLVDEATGKAGVADCKLVQ